MAYYLLYLLRSIMSLGTTHTTRLSAILSVKTTADSLLRSSLSGGYTLTDYLLRPSPSDETTDNLMCSTVFYLARQH
jgi:hypothetical protein